jgi:hypothetical protein
MSSGFTGTGGYGSGGYGYGGYGSGSWAWNPWFGMFTYMPYGGIFNSPFGFGYYSPGMVSYLYMPGSPYYLGGSGLVNNGIVARNGTGSTSLRNAGSTPVISRGGAASSSAPSVGAMRGGASAGPAVGGGTAGGHAGGHGR